MSKIQEYLYVAYEYVSGAWKTYSGWVVAYPTATAILWPVSLWLAIRYL